MINKYEELLEQLKTGEISELKIGNAEFFLFREAWLNREDRMSFVGEAHHGGAATYCYNAETVELEQAE
ncbi:hypothetical protein ACYSNR_16130 [Enterococcus sp. LJL128]